MAKQLFLNVSPIVSGTLMPTLTIKQSLWLIPSTSQHSMAAQGMEKSISILLGEFFIPSYKDKTLITICAMIYRTQTKVNMAVRSCVHAHHQFAPERFAHSHSEENVAFASRRVSAVSNFSW